MFRKTVKYSELRSEDTDEGRKECSVMNLKVYKLLNLNKEG